MVATLGANHDSRNLAANHDSHNLVNDFRLDETIGNQVKYSKYSKAALFVKQASMNSTNNDA